MKLRTMILGAAAATLLAGTHGLAYASAGSPHPASTDQSQVRGDTGVTTRGTSNYEVGKAGTPDGTPGKLAPIRPRPANNPMTLASWTSIKTRKSANGRVRTAMVHNALALA